MIFPEFSFVVCESQLYVDFLAVISVSSLSICSVVKIFYFLMFKSSSALALSYFTSLQSYFKSLLLSAHNNFPCNFFFSPGVISWNMFLFPNMPAVILFYYHLWTGLVGKFTVTVFSYNTCHRYFIPL